MLAVQFASYGEPDVLAVVDTDEPHAGPGEIRIAVRAAGVNAIDWKARAGYLQDFMPISLPAGTGLDAAGIIDEIGEGVEGISVGEAVFGGGKLVGPTGSLAEHAVLTHWAPKPDSISFEEAAGYALPLATATTGLDKLGVTRGSTVVISGAAGGVGLAAAQLALERGATVIGTASEGNLEHLRSLGVVATTYGPGLVERVRELAPQGVDQGFDVAGHDVLPDLVALTGDPQRVLTISDGAGAQQHSTQISMSNDNVTEALETGSSLAAKGAFSLPVARTFSLDQAADAHAASQAGHVLGRYIVTL